jgi:tRNA C32,U32 (ribose-2'-O)-methylase TrmJ
VNLGQAVAICLYELARSSRTVRPPEKRKPATAGDLERITAMLLDALRASGSLKTRSEAITGEKLRRLLRRHQLSASDAEFWLGMLRQIVWKLQSTRDATS